MALKNMKIVDLENIGTVWIKKNNRSRSIRISVNPYEPVTVTIPRRVSLGDSLAVVKQKEAWILQQLEKISRHYTKPGIFNEQSRFKTRGHGLVIQKGNVGQCLARRKSARLIVTYPDTHRVESKEVQGFIQEAITKTVRAEASRFLPARVLELARQHNFKYNKVSIKNTKSRWGSCSSIDNINLNLHLALLPAHLCDYVILHELVHTVEKNHGKKFWEKLNALTGDARKLRKELSLYSHYLYGIYPDPDFQPDL